MFVRVDRYYLQCDGTTTSGQCEHIYTLHDYDDEGERYTPLWEKPEFSDYERRHQFDPIREDWALMPDGRLLCPVHLEGVKRMAHASLDGLPFAAAPANPTPEEKQ